MSYAVLVYGVFNLTFQTFKSLHKRQRYSLLIEEYNEEHHGKNKMDGTVVQNRLDKDEMIPLLKLWTVLAFIQFYETYLDVFFSWIPLFSLVKTIAFALIVIPQTRAGVLLFELVVAPQLERRVAPAMDMVMPIVLTILLEISNRLHASFLTAERLRAQPLHELRHLEETTNRLVRNISREGYKRNRRSTLEALKEALPDAHQREALLDDILAEYEDEDERWTELRLERDTSFAGMEGGGGGFRLRFASDLDLEEEDFEVVREEEFKVDDVQLIRM